MEREDLILSLPKLRALCVGLWIASVVTGVWGIIEAWNTAHFLRSARRTQGMVVGHESVRRWYNTREEDYGYYRMTNYPMISFKDASGKEVVVNTLHESRFPGSIHDGKQVSVFYDPANSRRIRVDNYRALWGWTTILFASCVLCGLAAWYLKWYFSDPDHLTYPQSFPGLE